MLHNYLVDTLRVLHEKLRDTMGIDGRKKSILASFHGRYQTIVVADLRAIYTDSC
jgi:hypothetical protein